MKSPGSGTRSPREHSYAHAQLRELWTITQSWDLLASESPGLAERLRHLTGGAPFPGESRQGTARDAQSELFVGALLARAGWVPKWNESGPDWTIAGPTGPRVIEVKRASPSSDLDSLLRKANSQVRDSGHHGAVWIDASDRVTPARHSWKCAAGTDFGQAAMPSLHTLARHIEREHRARLGQSVDALILYCSYPVDVYLDNAANSRVSRHRALAMPTRRSAQEYMQFRDRTGELPVVDSTVAASLVSHILLPYRDERFYRSVALATVQAASIED